jgi:hypothetical protein
MNRRPQGPPAWVQGLLLHRFSRRSAGRSIVGDLHEEFLADLERWGRPRAHFRYLRKALDVAVRVGAPGPGEPGFRARAPELREGALGAFLYDLRIAARLLLRRPGLTLAAAVSLGLGIGANASMIPR